MNTTKHNPTRRQMLAAGAAAALIAAPSLHAQTSAPATTQTTQPAYDGPIIDIHQHTTYSGRSNERMFHHQKRMGITQTILLPGGTPVDTPSTLNGRANGLYAGAGVVETCVEVAQQFPGEYFFFVNEVPDLPGAHDRIESFLKRGAIGIGEQKFNLPCDSKEMEMIYALAEQYRVPVLMHFQHETFNTSYERFGKMLEKWPNVTFIGHAQTFWANIDAKHPDQKVLYPKGKVTPGGWTDLYLRDYTNFYADMSAGSGLNALTRDEDHARAFIERHHTQMLYGSDCSDGAGFGPTCSGSQMISALKRLSPSPAVVRQILYGNAKKLFKL